MTRRRLSRDGRRRARRRSRHARLSCGRRPRRSRSASCSRSPARSLSTGAGADRRRRPRSKGINDAGGIKSLGGAKLEMVLGDARSTPEGGTAEVERINSEGVVADRRRLREPDLPRRDPGRLALRSALHRRCRRVRRRSSSAGLKNTFRFAPGFGVVSQHRARQSRQAQRRGRQAGQDRGAGA